MKKRTYQTKNVKYVNWMQVKSLYQYSDVILAIDVAKEDQYGFLIDKQQSHSLLFKWTHPHQTNDVLQILKGIGNRVEIAMESTGTYGDALRYQFKKAGFVVYQVSAKRVNDAQEIYDGVPSLHDAKAAWLIARLHLDGLSQQWNESRHEQRHLDALCHEHELHTHYYSQNLNRIEALLQRHWPELTKYLDLSSATLEGLIRTYGSPEAVNQSKDDATIFMHQVSKGQLSFEKIQSVIGSAAHTVGQPCLDAEKAYFQALGEELHQSRMKANAVKRRIEQYVQKQERLQYAQETIGKVTVAILLSERLDPCDYPNAGSYLKALGLNLKEKSSGKQQGQIHITKRGSSIARRYLFYAALRLIGSNAIVQKWYQTKIKRDSNTCLKGVVAVMRKLVRALWYVFRGQEFDANKLFSCS